MRRAAERVGRRRRQPGAVRRVRRRAGRRPGHPGGARRVHDAVREGNTALADGDDAAVAGALGSVRAMLGVLGLDPLDPHWATGGGDEQLDRTSTDGLVALALEQRQAARARKDFAAADAIRDQLTSLGVSVEDTPQGPRWELTR